MTQSSAETARPDNLIVARGLTRRYRLGEGAVEALHSVDLTVQRGEFVAVAGVSGSGKSTLLHLVGGLDTPSGGELAVDGLPLHAASDAQRTVYRRRRVGFVFQSFNLLPRLTALENAALPLMFAGVARPEREQRARAILQEVGLGHRLNHYPSQLSGGEQQRVAIARALIHNPEVILADEPTGNLDSKTGGEILALLRRLNQERGVTVLLVTHDPLAAAQADRTVYLKDGQIERIALQRQAARAGAPAAVAATSAPGGRLRLADLLRSAYANLGRRAVRSGLTVFGVFVGIITIVTMLSVAVGVEEEVKRNIEAVGLRTVYVTPPRAQAAVADPLADPRPARPITPAALEALSSMPEVQSIGPLVELPAYLDVRVQWNGRVVPAQVPPTLSSVRSLATDAHVVAGRDLVATDQRGLMLSSRVVDGLGSNYRSIIGKQVALIVRLPRGETREFTMSVVGVERAPGETVRMGYGDAADIKIWWYGQPDLLTTRGYDGLVIKAVNGGAVPVIEQRVRALGFQSLSLGNFLELADRIFSLLNALLGSIGGLALFVAALGVTNTMIMAVYERTREIGMMKAVGASRGDVLRLFMAEASFIGFLGGAFGLLLGTLLGRAVDWLAHWYLQSQGVQGIGPLSLVPLWLAVGVVLFGSLIGLLAGVYPALRAARLDPVAALRYE